MDFYAVTNTYQDIYITRHLYKICDMHGVKTRYNI